MKSFAGKPLTRGVFIAEQNTCTMKRTRYNVVNGQERSNAFEQTTWDLSREIQARKETTRCYVKIATAMKQRYTYT